MDQETSIVCADCSTLVGGVEAGSRVRWSLCHKCKIQRSVDLMKLTADDKPISSKERYSVGEILIIGGALTVYGYVLWRVWLVETMFRG